MYLDKQSNQTISSIKAKQQNKSCFENLNVPATDLIEMMTKDYMEHLKISLETKSYKAFEDKINWLKSMLSARLSDIDIKDSLLDFHNVFTLEVCSIGSDNIKIKDTLNNFKDIIESIFH